MHCDAQDTLFQGIIDDSSNSPRTEPVRSVHPIRLAWREKLAQLHPKIQTKAKGTGPAVFLHPGTLWAPLTHPISLCLAILLG